VVNQTADALSHAPHEKGQVLHIAVETTGSAMKKIQDAQHEDPQLSQLIEYLEYQNLPEDAVIAKQVINQAQKGYYVMDGVLYFEDSIVPGRHRIVVPAQPRKHCCWKIMKLFLQVILYQKIDAASKSILLLAQDES